MSKGTGTAIAFIAGAIAFASGLDSLADMGEKQTYAKEGLEQCPKNMNVGAGLIWVKDCKDYLIFLDERGKK